MTSLQINSTIHSSITSLATLPAGNYYKIVGETQSSDTTVTNYGEGTYNSQYYGGETQTGIIGLTGTNILLVATISAVVLFCTILAIILRRPAKNKK